MKTKSKKKEGKSSLLFPSSMILQKN